MIGTNYFPFEMFACGKSKHLFRPEPDARYDGFPVFDARLFSWRFHSEIQPPATNKPLPSAYYEAPRRHPCFPRSSLATERVTSNRSKIRAQHRQGNAAKKCKPGPPRKFCQVVDGPQIEDPRRYRLKSALLLPWTRG